MKGFDAFHVLGRKGKRKKGRFSGGVSFYFKHDLKKSIKCLKNCQFNGLHALWVKFDKHFFHTDEHMLLCIVYILPENPSGVKYDDDVDIFDVLKNDIDF